MQPACEQRRREAPLPRNLRRGCADVQEAPREGGRGPTRPGRVLHHQRNRARPHLHGGPRTQQGHGREEQEVRSRDRGRQDLLTERRREEAPQRREEKRRHADGKDTKRRNHRHPRRPSHEGTRDGQRQGHLRSHSRTRRGDEVHSRQPQRRQGQRGVRRRDRGRGTSMAREEIRSRTAEGIQGDENHEPTGQGAPPSPRPGNRAPQQEGDFPRSYRPTGPRDGHQERGPERQGPLRQQARKARRRPHRGSLQSQPAATRTRPEVPAREAPQQEERAQDQRMPQARRAHLQDHARPCDRQLGRRKVRREPAARQNHLPGRTLPHEEGHQPARQEPATLRGKRPSPHTMGKAVPQRDARGSELRTCQERRTDDRRLGGGPRGGRQGPPRRGRSQLQSRWMGRGLEDPRKRRHLRTAQGPQQTGHPIQAQKATGQDTPRGQPQARLREPRHIHQHGQGENAEAPPHTRWRQPHTHHIRSGQAEVRRMDVQRPGVKRHRGMGRRRGRGRPPHSSQAIRPA